MHTKNKCCAIRKNAHAIVLVVIIGCLLCCALVACNSKTYTSPATSASYNPGLAGVSFTEENGIVYKNIAHLTSYIRELSKVRQYSEVCQEMNLLGISKEQYINSNDIEFGGRARVIQFPLDYMSGCATTQGTIAQNSSMMRYGESSVLGSIYQIAGKYDNHFRVSFEIHFNDSYAPGEYTDLIEIMCDKDLTPCVESDSNDYLANNFISYIHEDENGNSVSSKSNEFAYNKAYGTVVFPVNVSQYQNCKTIIVAHEFRTPDSGALKNEVPQYFAFSLTYAKASKNISLDSIGLNLGVAGGGSGVTIFPGISFGFSQKTSYDIWSVATGTWVYDGTFPVSEGLVYRIQNSKNTGLLGLLSRWMCVTDTSIESGALIATASGLQAGGKEFTFIPHFDGATLTYEILPYHIMGYCIGVDNGQLTMQPRNHTTNQRFRVEQSGEKYKISTYDGQMCFGLDNNGNVQVETFTNSIDQTWSFTFVGTSNMPMENAEYVIRNVKSGLFADIAGSSASNGTEVIQYEKRAEPNQKFIISSAGNGEYFIIPVIDTNKRLTVNSTASDENGANICISDNNNSTNQRFKIVRCGDNFKILTQSSNYAQCIGIANSSTVSGALLQQLPNDHTANNALVWMFA